MVLGGRPSALRLGSDGIPARVYLIENLGDSSIVDLQIGDAIVKMRCDGRPVAREGDAVHVTFAPEAAHLFDAATTLRR